jgi:dihydroxyacetone kinase-like predicted kinase
VVDFADGAVARGAAPDDTGVLRVVRSAGPPAAVVAVAPGPGLSRLFETEGALVVPGPGVSVTAVADAVRVSGAHEAVLLPNAAEPAGVAEAAAEHLRREGYRVAVVPTRSPVQGLAAVAVHDRRRSFDDDVVAMAEAAAATRYAEVTVAEHRSLTSVGICEPGDVLGLIDGEVVEIGRGQAAVALALSDRLLGIGAELVTVLVGCDAPVGLGRLIAEHVRGRSPLTEVTVYDVGQPTCPLIIGAE